MHPLLRVGSRPGHYTWLLASLLALLLIDSFVTSLPLGSVVTNILLGITLITSIYPVSEHRAVVWGGGTLATVMFAALWVALFTGSTIAELIALAAGFVFYLHAALVILISILSRSRISTDELAGAISVYLLLGISGAFIFAFLNLAEPGSVVNTSTAIPAPAGAELRRSFSEYLYFSFTCMTTLGFGELVPVSPQARVFAYLEAVIGQVYLTVLIARLVGLHLTHSRPQAD